MSLLVDEGPQLSPSEFRLIRDLINRYCGIYFAETSASSFARRLRERLRVHGMTDFLEYYRYLKFSSKSETELESAAEALTTNETYFFREAYQLRSFTDEVLPRLKAQAEARGSKRLTIWSAGCSSGEEVYTIAILLRQSGLFEGWDLRVFGNDISRRVLEVARSAKYRSASFRALPKGYDRYFVDTDEGRQVTPEIRSMCQFGHLNLVNTRRIAVVGRVDAVFCRNVLIYFDPASRAAVLDTIYNRLVRGGFLMLGHSESLLHTATSFELVQLSGDLVYRRPQLRTQPPSWGPR